MNNINNMKKTIRFALIAATVCSISLTATSCKDDDNSDNNGGNEVETIEGMSALEDDQLADLICKWTDTNYSDRTGTAWRSKTFDATVGLSLDESRPGVRTMAVGTVEQADLYAVGALGTLGIDYETPSGFTYSNDQVGKLAYQHGTDANTLGVISVDVKQIPGLQEIRLVKQLPENAGGAPYYKCGDLVKYNGRIYVCVSKHEYGQEARFITLNDETTHSRGKFSYWGVGIDSVYNDEMAKAEVIGDWLQNVVCDYAMWRTVRGFMAEAGQEANMKQVVPENNVMRATLIDFLCKEQSYIPDLQKGNPLAGSGRIEATGFPWKEEFDEDDPHIEYATLAPVGFLLADKLRYTGIEHKWVPYIYLAKGDAFYQVYYYEHELESQAGDPSHFKFKVLNKIAISQKDSLIGKPIFTNAAGHSNIKENSYMVCVIGMHWTHDPFRDEGMGTTYKAVFHFCADYLRHPEADVRNRAHKTPNDWTHRNITSRSLTFTDKGSRNKSYEEVYHQ